MTRKSRKPRPAQAQQEDLRRLEFSEPVPIDPTDAQKGFTTEAEYVDQSQRIHVSIKCFDRAELERYWDKLGVRFEVLPAEPAQKSSREAGTSQQTISASAPQAPSLASVEHGRQQADATLEINIKVAEIPNPKSPYILRYIIDPPISGGLTHLYRFEDALEARVTVMRASGKIDAALAQQGAGGAFSPVDPDHLFVENVADHQRTIFELQVTGKMHDNSYRLEGDLRGDPNIPATGVHGFVP
jgi:hypothetical protein